MIAVKMPCSGLTPDGDREGHRQRQRDDADRQAGAAVGEEAAAVVAARIVEQARTEAGDLASSARQRQVRRREAPAIGARDGHRERVAGRQPLEVRSGDGVGSARCRRRGRRSAPSCAGRPSPRAAPGRCRQTHVVPGRSRRAAAGRCADSRGRPWRGRAAAASGGRRHGASPLGDAAAHASSQRGARQRPADRRQEASRDESSNGSPTRQLRGCPLGLTLWKTRSRRVPLHRIRREGVDVQARVVFAPAGLAGPRPSDGRNEGLPRFRWPR